MRFKSARRTQGRILVILSLFMASIIVGSAGSSAAAATVYHSSSRGQSVYAEFYGTSPDGCVSDYAYVNAVNGQTKDSTGQTYSSWIYVSITRWDNCAQIGVLYGGTSEALQPGELVVNNQLRSATLNTTLTTLYDYASGAYVDVHLDLTWSATGNPNTGKSIGQSTYPDGTKYIYRTNGTSQQASAAGDILTGPYDFATAPSMNAFIFSNKDASLTVTRT